MKGSLLGIGLLAPGIPCWDQGLAVLAGGRDYDPLVVPEPEASLLPANERRRSSACVRWAVQVAQEAIAQSGLDARDVATVFASSGGEMEVFDQLCRVLATPERVVSPTLFHQSVHNTAAGYWGIATSCQRSSTALACYDDSFAAGLLEAMSFVCVEEEPVLLVAYDLVPPYPLNEARQLATGFAAALVLSLTSEAALLHWQGKLETCVTIEPTAMASPQIESLRLGNPAARMMALLSAIARGGQETVVLSLPDELRLVLDLQPCGS